MTAAQTPPTGAVFLQREHGHVEAVKVWVRNCILALPPGWPAAMRLDGQLGATPLPLQPPCAQLALSMPASSRKRPPVLTLTDAQSLAHTSGPHLGAGPAA